MKYHVHRKEVLPIVRGTHDTYAMLNTPQGCTNGCCAGISIHSTTDFPEPGVHQDQEGFCVLEGCGWAKVGDQLFALEPEIAFIVPANVPHSLKRSEESVPLKVFWFHAAKDM